MIAVAAPELEFTVADVRPAAPAAVPTLLFELRIDGGGHEIRSLSLNAQLRIGARRRTYDSEERERLFELFGHPEQWARSVRSLLWTQVAATVPPFSGETAFELPVPCTYDFDVAAAKYLQALKGGYVPLELHFSGTVFYDDGGRLQVAHLPWDREAAYRLPVRVWREAVEAAFPGTAWLRVRRDLFERLHAYKASRALLSVDAALEELLR